jgi:methylmalonyl-CoA/ethylmalonyl-CoA epimerase
VLKRISHVAVAVLNLDRACEFWRDVMGAEVSERRVIEEQKVEVAFVDVGGETRFELLCPTEENSPVGRFLAKHGPGLHHVCFDVDKIEDCLTHLADHGIKLVDDKPRPGAEGDRIAFLHPTSTLGALIELSETPETNT